MGSPQRSSDAKDGEPRAIEVEDLRGEVVVDGMSAIAVPEWLAALAWVNHQRSLGHLPN